MVLGVWFLAFLCSVVALESGIPWRRGFAGFQSTAREKRKLLRVQRVFQDLRDSLEAGQVPRPEEWEDLCDLPAPWAPIASETVLALRSEGGALVPALDRLARLAELQAEVLVATYSKTAQPMAQAWIAAVLTPGVGLVLYGLLPGLAEEGVSWWFGVFGATAISLWGTYQLVAAVDRARWGGLPEENRGAILLAFCVGESLWSRIRSGRPPDVAWVEAGDMLARAEPALALAWGGSLWKSESLTEVCLPSWLEQGLGAELASWGRTLREALAVSVWEGRPSLERLDAALRQLRGTTQAVLDTELQRLALRALIPLFVFSAPSALGLVGWGLYLSWQTLSRGGF